MKISSESPITISLSGEEARKLLSCLIVGLNQYSRSQRERETALSPLEIAFSCKIHTFGEDLIRELRNMAVQEL